MEKQSRKFGKSISVFLSLSHPFIMYIVCIQFSRKLHRYYSKILFYSKLSTTKASAYYIFNTFSDKVEHALRNNVRLGRHAYK